MKNNWRDSIILHHSYIIRSQNHDETVKVVPAIVTLYCCNGSAAGPIITLPDTLNSLPCNGQINMPWLVLNPIVAPWCVQATRTAVNAAPVLPVASLTRIILLAIFESPTV